jgi:hypothetical protein
MIKFEYWPSLEGSWAGIQRGFVIQWSKVSHDLVDHF